jgi:hypothetical protein
MIYSEKYNPSNAVNSLPYYRAFLDGTTPKIVPVGTEGASINAAYKGADTTGTQQVPLLDKAAWITYMNANNGAEPGLQAYSVAPKWTATAFNAVPVASAAPANSPAYLATGPRRFFEAILPYAIRGRGREYGA